MTTEHEVSRAEREFFDALLAGNGPGLDVVLADDFQLIDVMTGSEVPRAVLIDLVGSRQLRFDTVHLVDSRVRSYGDTAIVTGQTRMSGGFGDQAFEARSRYTHVYIREKGRWRLVAAQGTSIAT